MNVQTTRNKYEKLVGHIENEIQENQLKPGDKLPSIRSLAERFQCSNATVIKAYSQLEQRHLIYSVPKSGYYVIKRSQTQHQKNQPVIDLASAAPETKVLPFSDFQHCLNEAATLYQKDLFSYTSAQGMPSLRKTLVEHLHRHQIFTHENDLFITSGAQQSLDLLTRIPFPNGKHNILVEQPTYIGMLKILELNNAPAIGISRTPQGIDFTELERIFRTGNVKFFYTIPRFQNPTGGSYTIQEKKKIVDLAQKYNVYIVEDDYLADLELDSKIDPLYAYDTDDRVVYIKSYSKVLNPGLRIAVTLLPDLLKNTFEEHKRYTDLNTSIISQGVLEVYLKSGMFDAHISLVKSHYRDKMNCLQRIVLEQSVDNITCQIPPTGFFACFQLPRTVQAAQVINNLRQKDIHVMDASRLFLTNYRKTNIIRVSVSTASESELKQAVPLIFSETEKLLQNPSIWTGEKPRL